MFRAQLSTGPLRERERERDRERQREREREREDGESNVGRRAFREDRYIKKKKWSKKD